MTDLSLKMLIKNLVFIPGAEYNVVYGDEMVHQKIIA